MRSKPVRHLRLVDDRAERPTLPALITPAGREPGPWVLLDDTDQPVDVAFIPADVTQFVAMMLDLGVSFTVEPIGDRCRECGVHPTDTHIPNVCSKGAIA